MVNTQKSKIKKRTVNPSNTFNDTGLRNSQEATMFCNILCGPKKKKSLTAIIAAYRNIFVQLKTSDICCLDFINASRSIEQSCPTLGGNVRED